MKIFILLFNVSIRVEFRGFILLRALPWLDVCESLVSRSLP